MCGIIGCTGVKCAAKILYGGLEDLEYRGYDSAGIAVLEKGKIVAAKRKGRVCALKTLCWFPFEISQQLLAASYL